ncbi:MAG: hypothetical protein JO265_12720 [Acidimicrobiia bacterium]|nr:hypothetical protein [Acidimicrobiia bacterium]
MTAIAPGRARVSDRTTIVGLALLVIVLALPYAVRGPKLFLDDWWVLRNRQFSGTLGAAGHQQAVARPGAWLVFTLAFGVFGRHPLPLYVLQTLLNAAVAALLYLVLHRFLSRELAAAVVVVRAVLPNHSAMDHWASTLTIVVALLLLLVGGVLLIRACDRQQRPWAAVALFVASGLCYEATLPMEGALLIAVPLLTTRRLRWDALVVGGAAVGATGLWALTHAWRGIPSGYGDVTVEYTVQFGRGIAFSDATGKLLAGVAAAGVAVVLWRLLAPSFRGRVVLGDGLVLAGLLTIALGTLPFVKFPITVLGINDRADVITSIGGAMVWVGLGDLLWRATRRRPAVVVGAALAFLCCVVPARFQRDQSYWRAGEDAEQLLAALRRTFPHPSGPIVVGPAARNRNGVVGLVADWDTSAALQLDSDDPTLRARITPDKAAYLAAPETLRFNLLTGRREGRAQP